MTPEQFRRLQDLFEQAIDVPLPSRERWCLEQCRDDNLRRELLAMLRGDERLSAARTQQATALLDPALDAAADRAAPPPRQLGRFALHEEIGRGGMGRVFRAVRNDGAVTQEVAVKLVRRELASTPVLERFWRERQTLAGLNHPGIARLLDAGEAEDGTPYVAMELVRGENLLAWCAKRQAGIEERLQLFQQVLRAVAHAHRNLIVHRDIKPGNVLVNEDGQVKLLDFGIAKPLDTDLADTATAERYFTPAYASPEQFRKAPVGVGCDVYALGALLYELLAGAPPFRLDNCTLAEAERLILSKPPTPLDRACDPADAARARRLGVGDLAIWRKRLRGDLDFIVQRALRKEPELRYLGVDAFDADIENYLKGLPLLAAHGNFRYRARKFLRRNRVVVAVAATVLIALSTALGVSLHSGAVAARERDRAQAALDVLRDAFKGADPMRLAGPDLTARQILQVAVQRLAPLSAQQPLLFAELAADIGDVQLALGVAERDDALVARGIVVADALRASPVLLRRLLLLDARRRLILHDLEGADALLSRIEAGTMQDSEAIGLRAHYWILRDEPTLAVEMAKQALAAVTPGDEVARVERTWQLADALRVAQQPDRALAALDGLLAEIDTGPRALITRVRRAGVVLAMRRNADAIAESRALTRELTQRFGDSSYMVGLAYTTLGVAHFREREFDQAIAAYRAAFESYNRALGPRHASTIKAQYNLADAMADADADPAEVDRHFEQSLRNAIESRDAADPLVWYFRAEYAEVLLRRGERERAARILVPIEGDPEIARFSDENRGIYLRLLEQAFAPLQCRDPAHAGAPADLAARATAIYCSQHALAAGSG